jgi:chromosome segregation and condensation protein ScpB
MSLKAKLEAIVYAAETPVTLDQIVQLVKDSVIAEAGQENGPLDDAEVKSRVRAALEELVAEFGGADHGVEISPGRRWLPHVDQA